jgi:hypothetical protein
MVVEERLTRGPQGLLHAGDLGEDLGAVPLVFRHSLKTTDLSLNAP